MHVESNLYRNWWETNASTTFKEVSCMHSLAHKFCPVWSPRHWCNGLWLPVLRLALTQVSTVRKQQSIRATISEKCNSIKSNCPSQWDIPQYKMGCSLWTAQKQQRGNLPRVQRTKKPGTIMVPVFTPCSFSCTLAGSEADGVVTYVFNSSCSYLHSLSGSCQPGSQICWLCCRLR